MSSIEWTGSTWNPILGCSKVSEGCRNCYAIFQAFRNEAMGQQLEAKGGNPGRLAAYRGLTEKRGDHHEWTGKVVFVPDALNIPLKRKKPETYFVNSMSDMFHENVSEEWIVKILHVIQETPQHTYQVLTKRPGRMLDVMTRFYATAKIDLLQNLWLGVTVENQQSAQYRIPLLQRTPAVIHFLSCEPLLEEIDLWLPSGNGANLIDVDWVIVGGESGKNCRPCEQDWIQSIVDQCLEAHSLPVFVKQLGGFPDKHHDFDKFPASLQYRQMPVKTKH